PGARVLNDALARAARTHSELEDDFYVLLHAAGLPLPQANAKVGVYLADFLWAEQRLVVETDGWGAHGHMLALRRDPSRDAYLRALGYTVVRIPRARLRQRPYEVIAELAAALARG